jgi:predicted nucleic acid-binding protein
MRQTDRPSIHNAKMVLAGFTVLRNHHFWPDDASYADLPEKGVIGHRQVTDAYLVLLAAKHGGILATLDEALAAIHPGVLLV